MTAQPAETEVPLRPLSLTQKCMVALGNVAMGTGMTINFVVVAPLAREAGLTEIQVAGILTLSAAIFALMIPKWGEIAERFGRKRVMVFSLMAMATTNMAFLFALKAALAGVVTGISTFLLLVFVRLFFGFLSPGVQPASFALLTDATTSANRAGGLGMLGAAMGIGSIIGPAGASVLAEFGALAPLWGSIVFCATAGTIIAFALPESRGGDHATKPAPLKMRDRRIAPHLAFLFVYFVAVGAIQQTLAWLIEDRYGLAKDASVQATGIAFSCLAITLIIVQFGYVQPLRPDPKRILPVGLVLIALGYLGAALLQPFAAVCACFLLVGAGSGLAVPSANALGSLAVNRNEQGRAAALLSAAPPSGFVVGPLFGSALYMLNPRLPLFVSASVMAVLLAYRLIWPMAPDKPDAPT